MYLVGTRPVDASDMLAASPSPVIASLDEYERVSRQSVPISGEVPPCHSFLSTTTSVGSDVSHTDRVSAIKHCPAMSREIIYHNLLHGSLYPVPLSPTYVPKLSSCSFVTPSSSSIWSTSPLSTPSSTSRGFFASPSGSLGTSPISSSVVVPPTAGQLTATLTSLPTAFSVTAAGDRSPWSMGAIIGGVVGIVGVILCILLANWVFLLRRKRRSRPSGSFQSYTPPLPIHEERQSLSSPIVFNPSSNRYSIHPSSYGKLMSADRLLLSPSSPEPEPINFAISTRVTGSAVKFPSIASDDAATGHHQPDCVAEATGQRSDIFIHGNDSGFSSRPRVGTDSSWVEVPMGKYIPTVSDDGSSKQGSVQVKNWLDRSPRNFHTAAAPGSNIPGMSITNWV